jgi:hypothetical protein
VGKKKKNKRKIKTKKKKNKKKKKKKTDGVAAYVPTETTLMEMAAKIEKVKPAFLF